MHRCVAEAEKKKLSVQKRIIVSKIMTPNFLFIILVALSVTVKSLHFTRTRLSSSSLRSHGVHEDGKIAIQSPKGNKVSIFKSTDSLALALCNDFVLSAQNAISRSGRFYVVMINFTNFRLIRR